MKIATLGPKGTFSHEACIGYAKEDIVVFCDSIRDVLESLNSGSADKAMLPIENSIGGSVGHTLNLLRDAENIFITEEIILKIKHNLAGIRSTATTNIRYVFSHEQSYMQCEEFIKKHIPDVKVILTSSNSESALRLKEVLEKEDLSESSRYAAIIPMSCSKIYGLDIIEEDIQDKNNNTTRFIVLEKEERKEKTLKNRTSLFVVPNYDKPGLLFSILKEFAEYNINLTKIESLPSKEKLGEYIFFIEFEGSKYDEKTIKALKSIEKIANIKFQGSYPRAY